MLKEVPNLPSGDRHAMWIGKDELLTWSPRSDVAKPYPPRAGKARPAMITGVLDNLDTLLLIAFGAGALAGGVLDAGAAPPDAGGHRAHLDHGAASAASTACSACTSSPPSRC